jgi:hypothetical protein
MRDQGLVMSLTTRMSVQKLQTALHDKAKESPERRFHALYDKVYRRDIPERVNAKETLKQIIY